MLSKIRKTALALLLAGGMVGCSQKVEPVEKPKSEPKVEQVDVKAVEKQRTINYLTAVSNATTNSGKVATNIGTLFQKVSMHPQLVKNADWKSDLVKEYDKIQSDYDSVKNYRDVPEQYRTSYNTLLEGYDYFMQSKVKIMEAIETLDANKLQEGLDLVGKSTELITKSTNELVSVPVSK